ncbi:hypothetical protein ACT16_06760 [Mycobacterium heckeshornense]|nr:hypothetical protein ACT16_06760 [Mycobacterium heckeshornense]
MMDKLVEHAKRWACLPLGRVGPLMPAEDGDIAYLGELADRVFHTLDAIPEGDRLAATVAVICRHEMQAVMP